MLLITYIYIADWFSSATTESNFTITRTCGPCGNPATNDFCSDPATLTQGTAPWNNTTSSNYTADLPGNINVPFCGSIENNSWYQFTAIATTETFTFSGVGGATCGAGIQVQVYDVTTVGGCCTNFTSVSNCLNPGVQTGGTVTATPLVIGNQYWLMIDGNAGAGCDFTVANWDVSLPVELITFEGYKYNNGNKLVWATASEINNDYFIVQKSFDTKNYTDVGIVDGNGNSNSTNEYSLIDESSAYGVTYYRLKQIDFDGQYKYSKIVVITSSVNAEVDINLYPNPTRDNLYFDVSSVSSQTVNIKYTNVLGSMFDENIFIEDGASTYKLEKFKDLIPGFYIIQIYDENKNLIKVERIIKQ